MKLKELLEDYDEHLLSEEYLVEGLKIFKESKKLYKFSLKLTSKLDKIKDAEAASVVKKLAADVNKLADEYKKVEDDFANKKLNKDSATGKLKELKSKNEALVTYVKSARTKSILGKVGLGTLVTTLVVFLGTIIVAPELITAAGAYVKVGAEKFADLLKKAGLGISGLLSGKKEDAPIPGASQRSKDAPFKTPSTPASRAAARSRSGGKSSTPMFSKDSKTSMLRKFADDQMSSNNY